MLRQLLSASAKLSGGVGKRFYASEFITATLFPGARACLRRHAGRLAPSETAEVKENTVLSSGDGIGPEIADSVKQIFKAAEVPISWDTQFVATVVDERTNSFVTRENLDSVLVRWPALCLSLQHISDPASQLNVLSNAETRHRTERAHDHANWQGS